MDTMELRLLNWHLTKAEICSSTQKGTSTNKLEIVTSPNSQKQFTLLICCFPYDKLNHITYSCWVLSVLQQKQSQIATFQIIVKVSF